MSYLENRINALRLTNAVTFNAMTEQWLNPPDDEDERHDKYCRCYDCECASAEAYYDAKEYDRD